MKANEQQAAKMIALAEANVSKAQMLDSAELCLNDAKRLLASGSFQFAFNRAWRSLDYSVGTADADQLATTVKMSESTNQT